MKNQTLIGLAATTLIALATIPAWSGESAPSYANQIVALQKRCNGIVERAERLTNTVNAQSFKIAELERKVAGMQKQITLLHGKKVDKGGK